MTVVVLMYVALAFVIWMFYQAIARIGSELAEIKFAIKQMGATGQRPTE